MIFDTPEVYVELYACVCACVCKCIVPFVCLFLFHMECKVAQLTSSSAFLIHVIVIDLFNEAVSFNQRGGRSPSRWLNRRSS